jgi:hypothetical protein
MSYEYDPLATTSENGFRMAMREVRGRTREIRAHAFLNLAALPDVKLSRLDDAELLELARLAKKHALRFGGGHVDRGLNRPTSVMGLHYRLVDIFNRRHP